MNDKKEINQRNNDRFLPSGKMIDNRFEKIKNFSKK